MNTNNFKFTLSSEVLKCVLKALLLHVSKDQTRTHLAGVYLQVAENKITAVATDGHTLARWDDLKVEGCTGTGTALISTALAKDVVRACKRGTTVTVERTGRLLSIQCDCTTLTDMLDSQDYPNYEAIIPSRERGAPEGAPVGLNPAYMARAGKTLELADARVEVPCTVHIKGPLDPVRYDRGSITVVVMPMRI